MIITKDNRPIFYLIYSCFILAVVCMLLSSTYFNKQDKGLARLDHIESVLIDKGILYDGFADVP